MNTTDPIADMLTRIRNANSAKFIGEFQATDGQNIIDIINNKIAEAEASIKLDTKNIVLSVSEKTKERRNLLKGTTFHRQLDNFFISSAARIEMNSGYNGTNCIKVYIGMVLKVEEA